MRELAPAKANLILQVGARRLDGRHEICSLFASLELADRVDVEPRDAQPGDDHVDCPGVAGPNLASAALAAYRAADRAEVLPALTVRIEKKIPVAAGLGGGSADAAAVLRGADGLVRRPLGPDALRELAAGIGADVPSQIDPRHALVTGAGEGVEPITLPSMALVLVPQRSGLSTARVYAEADRLGTPRDRLDPRRLRELSRAASLEDLAPWFENDLEPAALALRPELADVARRLRETGAAAALITGSGPTVLGAFADSAAASRAAAEIEGAIATRLGPPPIARPREQSRARA
jgi:4-diphosphocytidyl-2-C-methyl-D-erythritol kinase